MLGRRLMAARAGAVHGARPVLTMAATMRPQHHLCGARRLLSSKAASTVPEEQLRLTRWNLRLSHDNTFLSYHRNAIIATVAGCALIQYRKGEGRPPLAGAGLLCMGGFYMYIGSALYVWQVMKLQGSLRLGLMTRFWAYFNAAWPLCIWSVSLACLMDETPTRLIEVLRASERFLPNVLHASLFIDPPAIYPVSRLLHSVLAWEEKRRETVRAHAAKKSWLPILANRGTAQHPSPLSDKDVEDIITRRLGRLEKLRTQLDALTQSKTSVPTALAAPLLDLLDTEVSILEKVLEVDTSVHHLGPLATFFLSTFVGEHKRLVAELDAVQALRRRIAAVRFTAATTPTTVSGMASKS